MSDSIRKQIAGAMVAALDAMTVAAGYNFDWIDSQKVLNRNDHVNLPVTVVSYSTEDKTDEFNTFLLCNLQVQVAAVINWDDSDDETALEDLIDDHVTDIERAVLAQNALDPVLGITGVERIRPRGHTMGASEGHELTAIVNYEVQYRHATADPRSYP